jgi:hypothetical protein
LSFVTNLALVLVTSLDRLTFEDKSLSPVTKLALSLVTSLGSLLNKDFNVTITNAVTKLSDSIKPLSNKGSGHVVTKVTKISSQGFVEIECVDIVWTRLLY